MNAPPKGWPRVTSTLFYDDPAKAIDWICRAFGFTVRIKVDGPGGSVVHSELEYGADGLIMVGQAGSQSGRKVPVPGKSPASIGGVLTQTIFLYVDDIEAHCATARNAGAEIVDEPTTNDYGEEYWSDRSYRAKDPEGHHWWFAQRIRTGK